MEHVVYPFTAGGQPVTDARARPQFATAPYTPQREPADPVSVADVAGGLGNVDALGTPLDQGINPIDGIGEGPSGLPFEPPPTGTIPDNIIVDREPDPGRGPDTNVPANDVLDSPQATSPIAKVVPWENPAKIATNPVIQTW